MAEMSQESKPDPGGFKACYRHGNRPATHTCLGCERPICDRCEEESGDVRFCYDCAVEEEDRPDFSANPALNKLRIEDRARRGDLDALGDVTIFSDGTVEAPAPETVPREEPDAGEEEPSEEQAPPKPRVKIPLAKKVDSRPEKQRPASARTDGHPSVEPRSGGPAREKEKRLGEEHPAPVSRREPRPERENALTKASVSRVSEARKRLAEWLSDQKREATAAWQLGCGFTFALACATGVLLFWLAIAFIFRRWTQMSVLILGIITPWAYFKRSGWRSRDGVREEAQRPAAVWISSFSLLIVAGVGSTMQVLAYFAIYRPNPLKLPFTDFVQRFFSGMDIAIIAIGLAACFCIPFVLQGEAPRTWSTKRVEGEHESDGVPSGDKASEGAGPGAAGDVGRAVGAGEPLGAGEAAEE